MIVFIVSLGFPMLFILLVHVLTIGIVEYKPVFESSDFWCASVVYWVCFSWIPIVMYVCAEDKADHWSEQKMIKENKA